jgi:hypothetical protein
MVGFKALLLHLPRTVFLVRPGTNTTILSQFLPPCYFTAFFGLLYSSSSIYPYRIVSRQCCASKCSSYTELSYDPELFGNCDPCHHVIARPPACFWSSSPVHARASIRLRSMRDQDVSRHLPQHCFLVATRNQRDEFHPSTATVAPYRVLQLDISLRPLPVRPVSWLILGFKASRHLL